MPRRTEAAAVTKKIKVNRTVGSNNNHKKILKEGNLKKDLDKKTKERLKLKSLVHHFLCT